MPRKLLPRLHLVLAASVTLLLTLAIASLPSGAPALESYHRSPSPPGDVLIGPLALFQPLLPAAAAPGQSGGSLTKLLKKLAKRQSRRDAAEVDHVAAAWGHIVALADLDQLLSGESAGTPKEQKKAGAALKKAAKKEVKTGKRLDKAQAKLDAVVAKIEAIDPGWFSMSSAVTAADVHVPVVVHEALPAGVPGVARRPGVATFGLPFGESDGVQVVGGRPALTVDGADVWQFRTLDTWPDGSVRWALCDVVADLEAGEKVTGLTVVSGPGRSEGHLLAMQSKARILLDTGPLQALINREDFNLLRAVAVDGQLVVFDEEDPGVSGETVDGQVLVPGGDTEVYVEENGPARAVVRADGTLVDATGAGVVDFTCRITARRESRDLEVTFTVRNASIKRPQHAVVEAIQLSTRILVQGAPKVTASDPDGPAKHPLKPKPTATALLYQAKSSAQTSGLGAAQYLPHLPMLPGDGNSFVEEGFLLEIDGKVFNQLGDQTDYPKSAWMDLSSQKAGLTVGIQHMAYMWPAALEARGDGTVIAGLFPRQNPAPFTFVWRQHESRSAVFSFHSGSPEDLSAATRQLDAPLSGRAADYRHYDRAGVFPYDLLSEAEQEEALAMMGIAHDIAPVNPALDIRRYLYKGTTGGANNQAGIEISLGGDWLRHGLGGDYLNGLDLALYKSEWQIQRSDDFAHAADPGAVNDYVPHSSGFFGDDEHRYREGIVLAYHLTGDRRFHDALFDEAEILLDVSIWPHERSTYQTLRAIAYVSEFTEDPALITSLRDRLAFVTSPVIDIETATSGYGWEAAPGQGLRGYYVYSGDNKGEKPPGENFQARGFISASLGPLGFFHAWRVLPAGDGLKSAARGRLADLSRWTRLELYPTLPDPAQQRLVYSYAVTLQLATKWENTDFHPILLGMAETWKDTGDAGYLEKGAEQLRAAAIHGDIYRWDTRLDVQHFLSAYRLAMGGQ